MSAPQLILDWTVIPNLRKAYTTVADVTAWALFQIKTALVNAGWSVKFSSNGTTGPSDSSDNTDRWQSESDAATHATAANAAQSWIVLINDEGVEVLLANQGSSADVTRMAHSVRGIYTLAGTTTHQPTASDEVVWFNASLVNSATSLDRVLHIWTTNDALSFFFAIFRSNTLLNYAGLEKINNLCAPGVFGSDGVTDRPYLGYRYNSGSTAPNAALGTTPVQAWSNVAAGSSNALGACARVYTAGAQRIVRAGATWSAVINVPGTIISSNTSPFSVAVSDTPALQGGQGAPMLPLIFNGESTANLDGILGYPIDWWRAVTSNATVPASGDFMPGYDPGDNPAIDLPRTNWWVAIGGPANMRPWRNASASMETA